MDEISRTAVETPLASRKSNMNIPQNTHFFFAPRESLEFAHVTNPRPIHAWHCIAVNFSQLTAS